MLNVDKDEVFIKGRKLDLMAEYALLTRQLIGADVLTEDEVDECITLGKEFGKKAKEEVKEEAKRIALDFFDKLFIII